MTDVVELTTRTLKTCKAPVKTPPNSIPTLSFVTVQIPFLVVATNSVRALKAKPSRKQNTHISKFKRQKVNPFAHTRRLATRQLDSSRERRSAKRSHVAATGVLHASPTNAPCCPVRPSTAWCRLERCLYNWHRLCDPGTVCKRTKSEHTTA